MDEQRRKILITAGAGVVAAIAGIATGFLARTPEVSALQHEAHEAHELHEKFEKLEHKKLAFGSGVSLLGPLKDPHGHEVFLRSIFGFSESQVFCTVEDNPAEFIFPTNEFGEVEIPANSFFMFMGNSEVSNVEFTTHEGKDEVKITGHLDCSTFAATQTTKFGGREIREPVNFEAEAVDGHSFAITVFFDEHKAPVNHAIFGPKFTFAGKIIDGSVVVREIGKLGEHVAKIGELEASTTEHAGEEEHTS